MQRLQNNPVLPCMMVCATALAAAGNLAADPLGGSRAFLCAVLDTNVCVEAAGCVSLEPEEINVPRFIQVDTKSKKLKTTAASGENRESIVDSVNRTGQLVILQGVEAGRAFSLSVDESTGLATFASAADGRSLAAFGACTPLPVK